MNKAADESQSDYGPQLNIGTNAEEGTFPKIDVWGAVLRRKFVVLLMTIIGAGVAYAVYVRTPRSYASSSRLMIWVQSPPTIVNGETVAPTVSLSKQQYLLQSRLVLEDAGKKLANLATFSNDDSPVASLKRMLRVAPVDRTDRGADTLEITCTGAVPEDLKQIVNEVVKSYRNIIQEDSEAAGSESSKLIVALQQKIFEEQEKDNDKYAELVRKLKLTSENMAGKWTNPFLEDLQKTKFERDRVQRELDETLQKIEQLQKAADPKQPELKKLLVLDARKSLQLQDEALSKKLEMLSTEERAAVQRLTTRIEVIENEIFDLETEKEKTASVFGPRHPSIQTIETQLQASITQRNRLQRDMEKLVTTIEAESAKGKQSENAAEEAKNRENEILRLYAAKLLSERERLTSTRDKLNVDLTSLEENSKSISAEMVEVNRLKEKIDERRQTVEQIIDKLASISVMSQNYISTKVRVIDEPSEPQQVAPDLLKYLAAGILGASLLGIGLAVLIDQTDLAFRTPIDIQNSLGVPVICKIPKIKKGKASPDQQGSPLLVTAYQSSSPASETFRAARTALLFTAQQTNSKVFLFTSPSPGDGKSTSIANLAVSLAQSKKRVVLIDADFRRPRVQQNFGVQFEPGVMDVISGRLTLDEAIRPCEFQPGLSLLTTGGRPKDPGELVASPAFADMIDRLRDKFDIVLIDSPPVLPVADATSLSSVVDGIFMVLRIRRGVMLAAIKSKERLNMVNANVIGVIVNGMDENVYYNEYGMYYRGNYYGGKSKYYDYQNSAYADNVSKEAKRAKTS